MVGHGRGHGRGYSRDGGHCHVQGVPDLVDAKTSFLFFRGLFGAAGFPPMYFSASLAPVPKNEKEHRDGNGTPLTASHSLKEITRVHKDNPKWNHQDLDWLFF